ncbi:carbohydrate porin [Commensalibacter intestini]|uniref:carbohydrate porin n=1 Tax=Commensalibacter intestini TaxID=479936 RepID=UPI00211B659C|nr:carbohydrate porin [Commensalibacter intestini]
MQTTPHHLFCFKNSASFKKLFTRCSQISLILFGVSNTGYARDSALISQDAAPVSNTTAGNPAQPTSPPAKKLDADTGQHPEDDSMLFGPIFGLRPWMAQYGVTFTAVDINDLFGNTSGGYKQGPAYWGVTTLTLNWDPEKVLGIKNGLFNISALQIRGRSLTADNLGDLNSVDNMDADRSTRLWELWYQQGFFDDKLSIKFGKIALDPEFSVSDYGLLFLNSSFGWSLINTVDTYNTGVEYPFSAPGIRFKFSPNENWTNLLAITDDNPSNVAFCNPSGAFTCDASPKHVSGTHFNFTTGVFVINELQYHLNPAPEDSKEDNANLGYPGTYKLGAYFDSAKFPDQRYNADGQLLGNPDNPQTMGNHRHTWSVYGIVDQMIWRSKQEKSHSVGMFGTLQTSPGDRTSITLAGNAGIVYKGLFNNENDSIGFAWGFGTFGNRARQYDRDYRYYADPNWRVRNTEHRIELVSQFEVTPWMQLTPDFQYIFNPGGGLNLEEGSYKRVQNEAVFALRSTVNF